MKKTISLALIILLLAVSAIAPLSPAAASKINYEKKEITAHLFNDKDSVQLSCLFLPTMPDVPYVSADDYLNQLYEIKFTTVDNRDGTYTVESDNGKMTVDTNKDTVHFDCYEDYVYYNSKLALESETSDYIDWEDDLGYVGEKKSVDLDIGKYHIDLIGDNGKAYFPLYTVSDIFSETYLSAIYLEGEIYFIRSQESDPYYDTSALFESDERSRDVIDYTYNELCFAVDYFYGAPPKSEIARDVKEKGFDAAIKGYNDMTAKAQKLLMNESLTDFCMGLMILDGYFDDGGHTMFSSGIINAMYSAPETAFANVIKELIMSPDDGEASAAIAPIRSLLDKQTEKSELSDEKETAYKAYKSIKKWDDAEFLCSGKTGIFVFDQFKDAVVKPFKWSLDYAAKHKFNNFVVDLTTNGGGSEAVVFYMMAAMCGKCTVYETNTLSLNRFRQSPKIDVNLDGKFDEKDSKVKYDLNFALLTTKYSFSSANLLPCIAKAQGIAVIGETSGGGTCALSERFFPCGAYYVMSSVSMLTDEEGNDLDDGAAVDVDLTSDSGDYERLYDIKSIDSAVKQAYANRKEPVTEPATEQETEKPDTKETEAAAEGAESSHRTVADDMRILWIILGGMALVLIILIVLIVILVKSSKKTDTKQQ